MSTTIDQYREAKNNYLKLKNQAKKELVARFNELANELLQVQRELLEDFGEKVVLPSKSKKPRPAKTAVKEPKPAEVPIVLPPKALEIQKQIVRQKKKIADTKAAGKPTKTLDDRLYELEDEFRLLSAN